MRTVTVILQARINDFTAKMGQAGKAAASVGKVAEAGTLKATSSFEKLQDTALQNEQAWGRVSNTLAVMGAAAAAAAGLAIREFAQFDQAMAGVESTGADAAGSIEDLRASALKMGADTAFSAVEAANGVEELARAGVSAADILNGGLAGALDLAAAGQIGVADAAGIAATAMTQFKLSGEDIPHLADLLAAGAGKAMGGVDELGQAMAQGGLVAAQFGLDIEETVGGLSAFAAAGLLGSDAGTSFKTMLLRLAKPSQEAQGLMDDLGIAAYDAQGNFVGLEGLAGQLETKLGGLTEKQRQSALATIFGTDAIRAATVLYENGASGISQWTSAVDDSGYAAATAAKLQDNLIGDLEKLGGAWSTLAIQMGEVGDGPLRLAVQGLEALVNIASSTPGAATDIMTAVVALSALAGGAALLMKGISGYAQYQTAMGQLAGSSPGISRAATAAGELGKALGIAGAAVVGLQMLGTYLNTTTAQTHGLEATATALTRVAEGITDIEGLDDLFMDKGDSSRQMAEGLFALGGGVDSLTSGFQYLTEGANEWSNISNGAFWDSLGNSFAKLVSVGTLETSADKITSVFGEIDTSLKDMSFDDATTAFAELRESLDPDGTNLPQLMSLFDDYASKVDAAAAAAGLAKPSQAELADLMAGGVVDGFSLAGDGALALADANGVSAEAAQATADAAAAESDAMQGVLDAAQGAADAIKSLNDAQGEAAGLFMDAQASADNYVASLQGVTAQIEENGNSTDQMTEKGRANREYLRGLAEDARTATDAMIANGDGIGTANASMEEMRASFLGVLGKFGIVGAEAEGMADSLGLIPNYVDVLFAVEGAKLSQQQADDLNTSLEGLPDDVKTQIITIATRDGYDQAMAALLSVDAVRAEPVIAGQYDPTGENQARAGVDIDDPTNIIIGSQYDPGGENQARAGVEVDDPTNIIIGSHYDPGGEREAWAGVCSVPDNTDVKIASNYNDWGVRDAKSSIASVQGKTVNINVVTRYSTTGKTSSGATVGSAYVARKAARHAGGGLITGPGTGTSDDVPILASNREFMLREWAASKIGLDRLNYMNRTGRIPAYAAGGLITPTGAPTSGAASYGMMAGITTTTAGVDLDGIQAAVAAGLAGARIVMDGHVIDARITTSQTRVARQVVRGSR